jgi:succinyldiaminopimelate transaminase
MARETPVSAESPPFVPPPYPYERLDDLLAIATQWPGGAVDLSIGTPIDPPPDAVVRALSTSRSERGYPSSPGSAELRRSIVDWIARRFGVAVELSQVAACVGTKEFVATLPHWLRLRAPDRDTVLYPEIAYPTYEMGAILAGCRAVAVPLTPVGRLALDAISESDAGRALALWVNSPSNPTGVCDDLGAVAAWGRRHGVPVFSDECYVEFTWTGPPRSILENGTEGVVAVHSLSKRSNLAGVRVGFYAGDTELVDYLQQVRKHVGMMVPGPAQAAAVAALDDDDHVADQRARYQRRLELIGGILGSWLGMDVPSPDGAFYLWVDVGDGWKVAEHLARDGGAVVSPGEFYGAVSHQFIRVAVVQPDERIELVGARLGLR